MGRVKMVVFIFAFLCTQLVDAYSSMLMDVCGVGAD